MRAVDAVKNTQNSTALRRTAKPLPSGPPTGVQAARVTQMERDP